MKVTGSGLGGKKPKVKKPAVSAKPKPAVKKPAVKKPVKVGATARVGAKPKPIAGKILKDVVAVKNYIEKKNPPKPAKKPAKKPASDWDKGMDYMKDKGISKVKKK